MHDDRQQRRSNTLRDRYTASVAVPRDVTEAERAAYERLRALQQGGSGHSDSSGVQHHAQPLKLSSNDSDAGASINCSDDTACECAPQAHHARLVPSLLLHAIAAWSLTHLRLILVHMQTRAVFRTHLRSGCRR